MTLEERLKIASEAVRKLARTSGPEGIRYGRLMCDGVPLDELLLQGSSEIGRLYFIIGEQAKALAAQPKPGDRGLRDTRLDRAEDRVTQGPGGTPSYRGMGG